MAGGYQRFSDVGLEDCGDAQECELASLFEGRQNRQGDASNTSNLLRLWSGYSELLDAIHPLWASARVSTNQTPKILHSLSGRSLRLLGIEDDELLDLSRAIQTRDQDIAVARSQRLDIYSMGSVMSALDYGSSDVTAGAVKPVQSLAYPYAWTGSCPRFIPTRPPWLRPQPSREGNIYLSLIEDELRFYVGLVAHQGAAVAAEGITYEFEEPYYLFRPRSHWATAISWGESAQRVVWAYGPPSQVLLCGIGIPSDGDPLDDWGKNMDRVVVRWQIPHGESDFTRYLTFDEPTGVSVIAMASGHIWIADPTTTSVELVTTFNPVSLVCPDPAWPSSHPTPWLRGITRKLIRLGERVLVIKRDENITFQQAWVLTTDSTVDSVKAHLHSGGTMDQLSKISLAVDELPTKRYAAWRHRVEPSDSLHL
ncbi:hypothetical protein M407DRAFT_8107 [Tulasnella calospora MUT 4182]|uniref:Uncharacterized protein n=1 Tax=Tulasnella calospora MUT 4182 TaxID=1051891 RepID=A0A0C3Q868_9AGAM|nr:hypothetical protein M407DRAFT_8107 [Tulasnella calospora MUT 4182]